MCEIALTLFNTKINNKSSLFILVWIIFYNKGKYEICLLYLHQPLAILVSLAKNGFIWSS